MLKLRLHDIRRLHDVIAMMLVDGRIIANDRVSSQRVFGKLGNVIGSHRNFRKGMPKDL